MIEIRDNAREGGSPRWDISQERSFVENLVGQRFNFLLVFFSIFIAGAVNARTVPIVQASVLSLGAIISFYLMLAIRRAQQKLDILLDIIFQDPAHPATVTNILAKGKSRRKLVGNVIPVICFVALSGWALYYWLG